MDDCGVDAIKGALKSITMCKQKSKCRITSVHKGKTVTRKKV
jgi:hypothetical protein